MPVPDKHSDESTVELDRDLYERWTSAVQAAKAWEAEEKRLRALLEAILGDSTAGTVNGRKVVSYREKEKWATTALQRDYPNLTQHFTKTETKENVFDFDSFYLVHQDVADKYRVREFRGIPQSTEE